MSPMSPRLLRPRAAGGFNPRTIANLAGWWDFNDAATVTVATGISAVTDKSGNGRTLNQSSVNNRPAWTANSINGKYAAVFDGTNDALTASFTLAQPVTAFLVAKYDSGANTGVATMMDGATGNTMRVYRSASNALSIFAGANLASSATTPESWSVWEPTFDGSSSSLRANGSSLVAGNAGTATPGGIYLGVFGNGSSNPGPVSVAAVLLYARALSASERSSVRKWLGNLYAITVA
jgi:hypothetical protein